MLDWFDSPNDLLFRPLPCPARWDSTTKVGIENVLCGIGVSDTFDLKEGGVWVRVALAALMGQVLSLHVYWRRK